MPDGNDIHRMEQDTESLEDISAYLGHSVRSRRSVLATIGSLGVGALAGCSSGRNDSSSTSPPEETTDTSTPTPTETEEPVSYPRRISQEELDSVEIEEVYSPNIINGFNNTEVLLEDNGIEIDYDRIERENDTRREQIKDLLLQTGSKEAGEREHVMRAMAAMTHLSWVDPEGENMMIDEINVYQGGWRAAIEMIYENEEGEKVIDVVPTPDGIGISELRISQSEAYFNASEGAMNSETPSEAHYASLDALRFQDDLYEDAEEARNEQRDKFMQINNNAVLGLNSTMPGSVTIDEEDVVEVTFSPDYWREIDEAFSNDAEELREMKVELSKAAYKMEEPDHAIHAQIENGQRLYEEITQQAYDILGPQFFREEN